MALSLLFNRSGPIEKRIGELVIDVFTEEDITYTSTVTDNPIETGESVTDHVFNQPTMLRIRGTIAGNPQFGLGGVTQNRRQEGYETLRELHEARQPVDVITGLETFTQMVITDLNIPRTVRNAASLVFNMELKQVRFVDSQRFDLGETAQGGPEGASDTAASTSNAGRQSTTEASAESAAAATSVAEETRPQSLIRSFF